MQTFHSVFLKQHLLVCLHAKQRRNVPKHITKQLSSANTCQSLMLRLLLDGILILPSFHLRGDSFFFSLQCAFTLLILSYPRSLSSLLLLSLAERRLLWKSLTISRYLRVLSIWCRWKRRRSRDRFT